MCPSTLGAVFLKTVAACLATQLLSTRRAFAVPIQQTQGVLAADYAHEGLRVGLSSGNRIGSKSLPGRNRNSLANLSFLSDVPSRTAGYRFLSPGQKLDNGGVYPQEDARTTPRVNFELSDYVPIAALEYNPQYTREQYETAFQHVGRRIFELLNAEAGTLEQAGSQIEEELVALGNTVERSVGEAATAIPKSARARQQLHDFGDKVVQNLTVLARRITRAARSVSQRLRKAIGAAEKKLDPSGAFRGGLAVVKAKLRQLKRTAREKLSSLPRRARALQRSLLRRKGSNSDDTESTPLSGNGFEETRL